MDLVKKIPKNATVQFVFFGLLLCTLPFLTSAGIMPVATLTILAGVLFYSIAALGLNLLLGYSGLVSLGTAGFMGLGAYMAAYFTMVLGANFWIALAMAIITPAALGIIIGLVSLRASGLYLGIMTLCLSEILLQTFKQFGEFTGGMSGRRAAYPIIFGTQLDRESTFIVVVIALVLSMIFMHNITKGHAGRAFHAMRGSEAASQAMGVHLIKYRLVAFALSTAMAGLAGAMYVFYIRHAFPTTWSLELSLWMVAAVVIGGFRSIYGTVIGCFVVWGVSDLFLRRLPVIGDIPSLPFIFNGVLIIIVIMKYPHGFIKLFHDLKGLATKAFDRPGQDKGGAA